MTLKIEESKFYRTCERRNSEEVPIGQKLWRDTSEAEKNDLLEARKQGKTILYYNPATFITRVWDIYPATFPMLDHIAYEVKGNN